ncbi:unnamed protein product [Heligmosomoides polygyrus]|uniref:SUZ domain-containing protein n=1 Tax=Heligmosomoides polygyrus TaxID=6339 RepID=A0A183FT15_HELPZ|nr:unnamed protein product [Heligmosomoides polygyrus]
MSSIAEEEWREYLVRRERELNRDVDDSTRPSGRFEPVPKRQQSATLADDKRRALKGDGSFNLPSNVYHSSGYASRPSELGEDPLSSVRTMRSQMRSLATRYRNSDTPVRVRN